MCANATDFDDVAYRVDPSAKLQDKHDQNNNVNGLVIGLDVHLRNAEVKGHGNADEESEEPEHQEDRNLPPKDTEREGERK